MPVKPTDEQKKSVQNVPTVACYWLPKTRTETVKLVLLLLKEQLHRLKTLKCERKNATVVQK